MSKDQMQESHRSQPLKKDVQGSLLKTTKAKLELIHTEVK